MTNNKIAFHLIIKYKKNKKHTTVPKLQPAMKLNKRAAGFSTNIPCISP